MATQAEVTLCRNELHDMSLPNAWITNSRGSRRCRKCKRKKDADQVAHKRARLRSIQGGKPFDSSWEERAECRKILWNANSGHFCDKCGGKPCICTLEIFFDERDYRIARRWCDACPVMMECRRANRNSEYGFFGGQSPPERRDARRGRIR